MTGIEVIQAVLRDAHDLVIKPVRQRPGGRARFASTDMHLLRKCPCPVWIDREPEHAEPLQPAQPTDANADPRCTRALAAVDATQPDSRPLNRTILDTAAAVAEHDDAALDVVHAWQAPFDGSPPGAGPVDHNAQLADVLGLLERKHGAALTKLAADYRLRLNGGDTHLVRGEPAATVLQQANTLGSAPRPRHPEPPTRAGGSSSVAPRRTCSKAPAPQCWP